VLSAMRKGVKKAKKKMIVVPMNGTTIPFAIQIKKGAGRVLLKPAPKGSGVIAGGSVRAVVEAAGIRDISSKILGTNNQASNVYATFEALKKIERIVHLKGLKLKSITEIEAEEAKKLEALQKQAASHTHKDDKKDEQLAEKTVTTDQSLTKETKVAPKKAAKKKAGN
jgi:ribosomal protein S5